MYGNLVLESFDDSVDDIEIVDRDDDQERDDVVESALLTNEGDALTHEFEVALDREEKVSNIADVIENTPEGLEPATGETIEIVVEEMLCRMDIERKKMSFEEYSTKRTKLRQTQVAVEGLREVGLAIWNKLIELIKRIYAWFKRANVATVMREHGIQKREEAVKAKLKKIVEEASSVETPPQAATTFTNPSLQRVLRVGTVVPAPKELVRLLAKHNEALKQDYDVFGKRIDEFNKLVLEAFNSVDSDETKFQDNYNKALAVASTLPAGMRKSVDQNRFGPIGRNCVVHEEPMVFSAKALFVTASDDGKPLDPDDVHFGIISSTGARDMGREQPLQRLPVSVALELQELTETHAKIRRGQVQRRKNAEHALDSIESKAERIARDRNSDKRTQGRGRALMQLVMVGNRLLTTLDLSLNSYDASVHESILTYLNYVAV